MEAMGSMAGQVTPRKKPRATRSATIQPKPAAAAAGDSSVRKLARRVLYPNTRLFKEIPLNYDQPYHVTSLIKR